MQGNAVAYHLDLNVSDSIQPENDGLIRVRFAKDW